MDISRRSFLKVGSAGTILTTAFGFDLTPVRAQTRRLKIDRTTETRSICPYCSVSCSVIIHTLGDKSRNVTGSTVVHVEGDPDSPINRGTLCPKGITLKQNIVNDLRLTKVRYRAPGSDKWEEKVLPVIDGVGPQLPGGNRTQELLQASMVVFHIVDCPTVDFSGHFVHGGTEERWQLHPQPGGRTPRGGSFQPRSETVVLVAGGSGSSSAPVWDPPLVPSQFPAVAASDEHTRP